MIQNKEHAGGQGAGEGDGYVISPGCVSDRVWMCVRFMSRRTKSLAALADVCISFRSVCVCACCACRPLWERGGERQRVRREGWDGGQARGPGKEEVKVVVMPA